MRESDKIKGKAAIKQDLEDTLSFYNDALTKKVVGQLFDEYVKEDEDLYYTRDIEKHRNGSDNSDYYENSDIEDNSENTGYYFGDTFNSFSKENLLPDYNDTPKEYIVSKNENTTDKINDNEIADNHTDTRKISFSKNKKEYYEFDDFEDDFDQYDYEPKKKPKKEKKAKKNKIKKIKTKKYEEYEEYEDVLDRKKNSVNNNNNTYQYNNIIIRDLSSQKKDKDEKYYTQSLPPLDPKQPLKRGLGYEDVIRYSPRRRGGRNQTIKKKKRIPLSENKNIYPEGIYGHSPKRKKTTQKSRVVINSSNVKKKRPKTNRFFLFLIFILTIALIFCILKINSLKTELENLKTAESNYQSEELYKKYNL